MNKINFRDVLICALSVILSAGAALIFEPCPAKADGSFMTCHWAGQAVIGLGGVMTVISLIRFFVSSEMKQGLDLALIPSALLAAYLPNNLITLCKMETMRCHAIFNPTVILVSALVILAAAADFILRRRERLR